MGQTSWRTTAKGRVFDRNLDTWWQVEQKSSFGRALYNLMVRVTLGTHKLAFWGSYYPLLLEVNLPKHTEIREELSL